MQHLLSFLSLPLRNEGAGEVILDDDGSLVTNRHVTICNPYGFVVQSHCLFVLLVGLQIETNIVEQRDLFFEILSWSRIVDIAGRLHALLIVLIAILGIKHCDLGVGTRHLVQACRSYPTLIGQSTDSGAVAIK